MRYSKLKLESLMSYLDNVIFKYVSIQKVSYAKEENLVH